MVVVKKPQSKKLRICIDLRDLNQALQRSRYPQSTIEDILPQLSKAKVFSVLDAKDGFWQVKLDEKSSYLTTFWSPCGRLRWLRIPFGINTAPEEYQRGQTEHVSDLPAVAVIANDHLLFGCGNTMMEACKDHDSNLRRLLERARKIGLRFNSAKMRLRHEKVRYLGHLISGDGLKPDPEKVAAIMKMQKPTDIKSMQWFIGFVNYLAKFLPNSSIICEPLPNIMQRCILDVAIRTRSSIQKDKTTGYSSTCPSIL